MSELRKEVGRVALSTWLDGHPRWTKLEFKDHSIQSMQPEDLRDLRYAIDRLLAQIDEHDARFKP